MKKDQSLDEYYSRSRREYELWHKWVERPLAIVGPIAVAIMLILLAWSRW